MSGWRGCRIEERVPLPARFPRNPDRHPPRRAPARPLFSEIGAKPSQATLDLRLD